MHFREQSSLVVSKSVQTVRETVQHAQRDGRRGGGGGGGGGGEGGGSGGGEKVWTTLQYIHSCLVCWAEARLRGWTQRERKKLREQHTPHITEGTAGARETVASHAVVLSCAWC